MYFPEFRWVRGQKQTERDSRRTTCCWCLRGRGCCGWAGRGSTAATLTAPTSTPPWRCSTPTSAPPSASSCGPGSMLSSLANLLLLAPSKGWSLAWFASLPAQVILSFFFSLKCHEIHSTLQSTFKNRNTNLWWFDNSSGKIKVKSNAYMISIHCLYDGYVYSIIYTFSMKNE